MDVALPSMMTNGFGIVTTSIGRTRGHTKNSFEKMAGRQRWWALKVTSPEVIWDFFKIRRVKGPLGIAEGLLSGTFNQAKPRTFTGVIARAADAGYKFIIVIAGIHNNLRRQTQERIDKAFIGRSSDPENRHNIGVGLAPGYPHILRHSQTSTMTSIRPLRPKAAGRSMISANR